MSLPESQSESLLPTVVPLTSVPFSVSFCSVGSDDDSPTTISNFASFASLFEHSTTDKDQSNYITNFWNVQKQKQDFGNKKLLFSDRLNLKNWKSSNRKIFANFFRVQLSSLLEIIATIRNEIRAKRDKKATRKCYPVQTWSSKGQNIFAKS